VDCEDAGSIEETEEADEEAEEEIEDWYGCSMVELGNRKSKFMLAE